MTRSTLEDRRLVSDRICDLTIADFGVERGDYADDPDSTGSGEPFGFHLPICELDIGHGSIDLDAAVADQTGVRPDPIDPGSGVHGLLGDLKFGLFGAPDENSKRRQIKNGGLSECAHV